MTSHSLTDIVATFKHKPIGYTFKLYKTLGIWQLKSKENELYTIQNLTTLQIITTTLQQQIF